jgi:hypothetical protein
MRVVNGVEAVPRHRQIPKGPSTTPMSGPIGFVSVDRLVERGGRATHAGDLENGRRFAEKAIDLLVQERRASGGSPLETTTTEKENTLRRFDGPFARGVGQLRRQP